MISLMLFGYISYKNLGVGFMPDVDFPVLNVRVTWEGAAPEVIESDVVDVIEGAVTGVQGLKEVSSTSRQGNAQINLEFELDRDIDVALQEVQSKISEVQRILPPDIDPPIIIKSNPEDQPILWLGVSTTKSFPDLMEFVDRNIADQFKTIPGVADIFLSGYVERNMRIWLDTDKLKSYQLTVQDVIDAIQREHLEIPAGRLETSLTQTSVRAMGEAKTPEQFGEIAIDRRGGEPIYKPLKLKDVARIEDSVADIQRITRVMGTTAVGLGIRKQHGANTVAVGHAVKKRVQELQKQLPKDYSLGINFDSTRFIEESVDELVFTLILSAILTSIVCWVFLGSFSSTINILLAIPTSLLGTFLVLHFFGFTLNTFTLLGLTLAIGIVVDDAIMVLENIVRRGERGEKKEDAALHGAEQISFAALAATIAIVAIFLPVAFMQGIIGKFFFQFGITISAAVMISLLEALTFAPMRCADFLEVGQPHNPIWRTVNRWTEKLAEAYGKILVVCLRHKMKVIVIAFAVFFISCFVVPRVKKEFVPAQDQSMFLARLETPIGSSIHYTSEKFKEVEKMMQGHPSIDRYFAAVGGFEGGEPNSGNLFVTLKKPKDRSIDPKTGRKFTQSGMMDYFREQMNTVPDLKAFILDLSSRGFSAQRGYPIEFNIRGPNWEKLAEIAEKFQEEMRQSGFFVDVNTDYVQGVPEVKVYPDRDKAFAYGVDVRSIAKSINAMIGSEKVSKFTKDGRRYDVRVSASTSQRENIEDIEKLWVRNNRGEMVNLKDVAKLEEGKALLSITRRQRERAISIFANPAPGKAQQDAVWKVDELASKIVPENYRVVSSGTSETFRESFQSLLFAFLIGIIVSYMVLASQFNHLVHPLTVLLALPFALTGAFFSLWVGGFSLNIFSAIGLILLMGIVKKNSILLVEFTNQLREQGLKPYEALMKACPMRLRPILMTTVATIAAAVPPALALGPGAETRVPMAVSVIGGVSVSTILTLFVVPAAYLLFARMEEKPPAAFQNINQFIFRKKALPT